MSLYQSEACGAVQQGLVTPNGAFGHADMTDTNTQPPPAHAHTHTHTHTHTHFTDRPWPAGRTNHRLCKSGGGGGSKNFSKQLFVLSVTSIDLLLPNTISCLDVAKTQIR